jgi:hypothetical protein
MVACTCGPASVLTRKNVFVSCALPAAKPVVTSERLKLIPPERSTGAAVVIEKAGVLLTEVAVIKLRPLSKTLNLSVPELSSVNNVTDVAVPPPLLVIVPAGVVSPPTERRLFVAS